MKHGFTGLDKGWLVAALLPLIGIIPTLHGAGIIDTADGLFHTHRIFAMTQLMAAGTLYPRWIPWFHLGYGYPVFNFYAPAASYLGGLLGLIGISAPVAYTFIAALSWIGGSVGMYGLARRYLPGYAAILAAALWAYAPSHLQDVWNIGNLSQIIGAALVPWLFYLLARAIDDPGYRRSAALGLAFGAVILAHQPTTIMVALFIIPAIPLMILWVARHDRQSLLPRLACAGGGLALGLAISLIFTLPLLLELRYIKASLPATDIPSVLFSNFLGLGQVFQQPAVPDLSDISRGVPDGLGLIGGILGGIGFAALLWKRHFGLALAWSAALAVSLFLLLDISFPVWLAVPLLDQLRFPARILRIAVVFLALLGGACLLLIARRYALIASGILLVLVIGVALPTTYPTREIIDFANLTARDEIEYEQETFAFGGTSYNEFKPIWATRTPFDAPADIDSYTVNPLQIGFIDPGVPGVQLETIGDLAVRVQTAESLELSFRHFYFPGWSAAVNGTPVDTFPKSDMGLLTITVPPGDQTVTIAYAGTPAQNIAPLLSLASLALTGFLFIKGRNRKGIGEQADQLPPRFAVIVACSVIAFSVVNTFYIAPQTMWFRQRSPLDAPAAMQTPVHTAFGDAYELLGYTIDQQATAPGEAVRIMLFWRALRPLDRTYRPLVQLVNPGLTEAWAANEDFFIGANPTHHTPDYFVSDVHLLRVFDNAPPYIGRISVKLVDPQTEQPLLLPDGRDTLMLDQPIRVMGNGVTAKKMFENRIGDAVELWCASIGAVGDQLHVDLYWHVLQPPTAPDLRTFVHGLDAAGNFVAQDDRPPLKGDYAPLDWLPGQTLVDHYTLPNDPAITQVAVGLYIPNSDRLTVTQGDQPVPDNRIIIPIGAQDCVG